MRFVFLLQHKIVNADNLYYKPIIPFKGILIYLKYPLVSYILTFDKTIIVFTVIFSDFKT